MSNVIRFLEKIGSEAQWGDITKDAMELALMNAEIENPLRSAILDKDAGQLHILLQQKPLIGFVMPAEEPGEEEEEESEDEPGKKDARNLPSYSSVSRL